MMDSLQGACACSKAELELFTLPPVNISMERGDTESFRPVANLSAQGPLEFYVPGSSEQYIDLGRTRLRLKFTITKLNGDNLAAAAKVAPCNNFLHSLFSQVDFKLNDTLVSPSTNTYSYKSYLETILSHGSGSKETWLANEGYSKDDGDFNEFDPAAAGGSSGYKQRQALTALSHSVELIGRPHLDMLHTDRYLLSGVNMSLKFIFNQKLFYLLGPAAATSKLNILEAELYVRRVKINPTISLQHTKTLEGGVTAKYPIRRGVVVTFTVPQGNSSFSKESLTQGQLPRRVFLALNTNEAFNGSATTHPFDFKSLGLDHLVINNGSQNFPSQSFKPDFAHGDYAHAYQQLYAAAGIDGDSRGLAITREDFGNSYAIFGFDLTADLCEGAHVDPIKHGGLRVEGHFNTPLAAPINCIVYCEYDCVVQIDRARNVFTDFSGV